MSYEKYPFWLKNQRDSAESEASFLRRENEQLKNKIKELEKEIEELKKIH